MFSFKFYNVANDSLRLCNCCYNILMLPNGRCNALVNAGCYYDAAGAVAGRNTWKFLKLSMLIWLDCLSRMSPTDFGAIQGWFRHSATDPRLLELKTVTVNRKIGLFA